MKLVFAHDHKLQKNHGNYYTTGGLSDQVLSRYLTFFDELTVFSRVINSKKINANMSLISSPQIHIAKTNSKSLILRKDARSELEQSILEGDGLVVKLPSIIAEQAIYYARKYHKPYLVELVADPWDSYWTHSFAGKIFAPIITSITKAEVKRAPYVLYVTDHYLQSKYPTVNFQVACSDVVLPPNSSSREVLNTRLEHISKVREIRIVGSLSKIDDPCKDLKTNIAAVALLKQQYGRRIIYKIAGNGDQQNLRDYARKLGVLDQVEFCGMIPHNQVFQWIQSLDLFLQSSVTEGLPRAVVEALSQACPTFGTDVGGIPELLPTEALFPVKDFRKLASLIYAADESVLSQNAIKAFQRASAFDQEKLAAHRSSFYNQFAEQCRQQLIN